MNEIQTDNFDYSILDSSTAEYLKDRENSMSKTLENAAEKLGEDLSKAKEKLSKKGYGCFEEWYTSLGLKRQSVYNYINRFSYLQNLEEQNQLEIFQELTPSLQSEMSKSSANTEINQKVFDGDITNHKEYKDEELRRKEAERRAEEAERQTAEQAKQLEQAQRSQDILQSKLEDVENKEPERIEVEKEVVKEVVPEDYENMKNTLEDFRKKFNRESQSAESLREELKKYTEAFSDPSKAHEESQVKRLERESSINAYKLSIGIQRFIEDNAVESYKVSSVIKSNDAAKKRLEENIELLEDFTTNIKALLNGRIITN